MADDDASADEPKELGRFLYCGAGVQAAGRGGLVVEGWTSAREIAQKAVALG